MLNFNFLKFPKFHGRFHLWEDEHKNYMLTDVVEVHFAHIPKEQLEELMAMDPLIKKAEERLQWIAGDKEMMEIYYARDHTDSEIEFNSLISSAEEKGKDEGKIEGKIETVRNLLAMGFDVTTVARAVEMSVEEVEKLSRR